MRFIRNFLLILSLSTLSRPIWAAGGYTPLELNFATENSSNALISTFLKQLDSQIYSLLGGSELKCVINVDLAGGPAGLSMQTKGATGVLTLTGEPGAYTAYSETMLKIIGVLAHAKLGRFVDPERARVPDWIGAAILSKLEDNLTFSTDSPDGTVVIARVFRPYRDLSGMRLLMTFGELPDFQDFLQLRIEQMPPVTREAFTHYSRFMLDEVCAGDRQNLVLGEYLTALVDGMAPSGAAEMILGRRIDERAAKYLMIAGQDASDLSTAERRRRYLTARALRVAFNVNYPYNPIAARRQLAELQKVYFKEFNQEGAPTGKLLSCDLSELPELLEKHPDGRKIWSFKLAEFSSFRQRLSFAANKEAQELEKVLMKFPSYWFSSGKREIKNGVTDLARAFERQQKWFDYVVKMEERLLPGQLVYARELEVERFYSDSNMSAPMKAYLDSMALNFSRQ